ncbi:set domain-containing protein [Pyrenophora tritici-repentis]|uniref:SET domain-containing protein n=2 Tax=Pyrenophora tritici-repentis TaxID=45151 RepID=B2WDJ8_PYRTR|nr:uncharacterized protein PTRG_08057 [Pyrenophora tritici-repentis Pt-1C-BFP]KAA8616593.1 set domain-containing protein [Pyrenophora tritici-repentis]EDU50976.1 predicted protein [Pyrenophora tritici-repentis Pt-1C-BFP]KAF7566981.1 putative set domain-containing protein [Pyrenophora tritici-repentis]KAG9381565.1 set domain-containing protein [Pyrenophora tritici-repentis]KAI0571221.1 set domain-containing protein [Pyrenophora tritici-repentis]
MFTPPDTTYQIVKTRNKGRGMVASRDIAAGEVILRETPLVVLPYPKSMAPLLLLLPKQTLKTILLLHSTMPDEKKFSADWDIPHNRLLDALMGCINSNSFDGKTLYGLMGILVLTGPMFNHDSSHNVTRKVIFGRKQGKSHLEFSAVRNIVKDEELTVLYNKDPAAVARYGILESLDIEQDGPCWECRFF